MKNDGWYEDPYHPILKPQAIGICKNKRKKEADTLLEAFIDHIF